MKKIVVIALCASFLPLCGRAQDFSLSTNVVDYANMATVNLQLGMGISRHWSVDAGVKYNPFSFGKDEAMKLHRQKLYSAGMRFWPWHIFSGWWLGGKLQYQEFNTGGITSVVTSQGDRYGGSLSGGYTYMISPHLNVEVGVGFWSGYEVFTSYACQKCGRIVDSGQKFFIKPNDLMLSLSFIF